MTSMEGMSGAVRCVVHAGGEGAGLGVPEVDEADVGAFGGVVVGVGAWGEEVLDVVDDAGQEPNEAEFFTWKPTPASAKTAAASSGTIHRFADLRTMVFRRRGAEG
jgi:hypothetical protein